jgi:hydroxymethylbilane synthase
VGTRASALATRQTGLIVDDLRDANPDVEFELVEITSRGDADRVTALDRLGVGVFVTSLEDALLDGRVDLAVHSLKDMPSVVPPEFALAAISEREDPREALVNRWGVQFSDLPDGARIGTGSPRRRSQLLSLRPDLQVISMRGNVETRLKNAIAGEAGGYDGAILAAAGMSRLGRLGEATGFLDVNLFVPAAGQGALGLEIRANDERSRQIVEKVSHRPTRLTTTAERSFLTALGGGCSVPVSAYGRLENNTIILSGFVSDLEGTRALRKTLTGPAETAVDLGRDLASAMEADGAREILAEIARD